MQYHTLLHLGLAFLLSLSCASTQPMDSSLNLEIKKFPSGQFYSLLALDGSLVAQVGITLGSGLAVFGSPMFDEIDLSTMPDDMQHVIAGVKSIKQKYDLNKAVMIGDVYVSLSHRGKGYAHHLLEVACEDIFKQGFETAVLIPDPFEYKDGQPMLLNDEEKKQKLIKLYGSCGFKEDNEGSILYMYCNAKN